MSREHQDFFQGRQTAHNADYAAAWELSILRTYANPGVSGLASGVAEACSSCRPA
ncbi:hypothetical protein [Phenylobacterium sp.]|jgi:hypothetical protein|uniref:hypothetical protein n=1 Tax=Phenylobacterium sp. TaxID=1871053 RepID=UPI002F94B811